MQVLQKYSDQIAIAAAALMLILAFLVHKQVTTPVEISVIPQVQENQQIKKAKTNTNAQAAVRIPAIYAEASVIILPQE